MTPPAPTEESVFADAIRHWWSSRAGSVEDVLAPEGRGNLAHLRGNTMNGFRDAVIRELTAAGVRPEDIFSSGNLSTVPANLPSYFRASKNWDVIVCKNSRFKCTLDAERDAAPAPHF